MQVTLAGWARTVAYAVRQMSTYEPILAFVCRLQSGQSRESRSLLRCQHARAHWPSIPKPMGYNWFVTMTTGSTRLGYKDASARPVQRGFASVVSFGIELDADIGPVQIWKNLQTTRNRNSSKNRNSNLLHTSSIPVQSRHFQQASCNSPRTSLSSPSLLERSLSLP